jgi:FMN-dependent NADH-azoreductase
VSNLLIDASISFLKASHPTANIVLRDLVENPVPVLHQGIIDAIRSPPGELSDEQKLATLLSGNLISEIRTADLLIIGAPMYNWSIPAALKAWIDQVMRVGHTFDYGAKGPKGLMKGKRAIVIQTRGGAYSTPEKIHLDFQEPYIKAILGIMGITAEFITVEYILANDENFHRQLSNAKVLLQKRLSQTIPN